MFTLPPSFHLEFLTDSGEPKKPKTLPGEFDLVIKENKRITAQDHFQDVRHIELECDDPSFR
jgi:sulfite reductase alpha subunit-like flavoprotein